MARKDPLREIRHEYQETFPEGGKERESISDSGRRMTSDLSTSRQISAFRLRVVPPVK